MDEESAWRKHELMQLRLKIISAEPAFREVLIRAGIALNYAHWEGFIKTSTELLLSFISGAKEKNSTLSTRFIVHSVKSEIESVINSKNPDHVTESLDSIIACFEKASNIRTSNYVDTESNLSSKVFDRIARSVGVDTLAYSHLYPFIDETILANRHKIAHGEKTNMSTEDYQRISDRVMDLMYQYKSDIENIAATKSYLRKDKITIL
ncbi:MAE_28990/MAE_18760 family HEPN-like nuclease [uncultured Alcanivorax sp.]|uniref:MAE_28990/MAE_18760 family HEPN-like nuclease n=1 Tax=uncultured Alcanivorax sp. TaxID=191215 RepID=UPI00261D3E1F|nr:MAE_28990/MAE_18760 family HEPN-like nuclease [uncultured Alcanivorax sp.]